MALASGQPIDSLARLLGIDMPEPALFDALMRELESRGDTESSEVPANLTDLMGRMRR